MLQKKHWSSEQASSFIVGGPDGNLASSIIKNSLEKIVGIVDASGIIYDPKGLDQEELDRLCDQRVTISHYTSPLSSEGFQF